MSTAHHLAGDAAIARSKAVIDDRGGSRLVLATTILASSLASIDSTVVNVGLSSIGADLGAVAADLQWLVNAYLLPLSALILLGGALGDRFGRRGLLITGTALFALASLTCALAPTLAIVLSARFVQGVGAAIVMPNSLAILGTTFHGTAKGRAIGIWAAFGAMTAAVGPLLGGWLIDVAGWRAIFLINLPLAAAVIAMGWRYVPAERERVQSMVALDVVGALLAAMALAMITFGLTEISGTMGGSITAPMALAGGSAVAIGFVIVEKRRGEAAMMPLAMFGSARFVGLTLLTFFLYAALGILFVLLPYILIVAGRYSAAEAGAALLPFPLILAITSPFMGGLAARIGPRWPLTIAPLVVAAGFLLVVRIGTTQAYGSAVFPAIVVIALGMSGAVAPLTTAVLAAVDDRHAGSASGFNSAVARAGGLVAVGSIGSVLAATGPDLPAAFAVAAFAAAAASVAGAAAALLLVGR